MRASPTMSVIEPVSFLSETPGGVAGVMAQVEQKWLDLSMQFHSLDCEATHNASSCTTNETRAFAFQNFSKSCHTVSKAIVQTAAGDRSRVQAYMSNVCGQDDLKGKPEELCLDFSQYLVKEMSEYQHDNMEGTMDLSSVCADFFNNGYIGRFAEQEHQRLIDEDKEKAIERQRKADEAEEAQAKAEVEAKAAIAREHLAKMQNATAEADAKRQEAVSAAVEAQRKAEASEAAVELQKHLKEEADAASKKAEEAQAKAAAISQRIASRNVTTSNHTEEAKESRNTTAKSFLAVAPFTFS